MFRGKINPNDLLLVGVAMLLGSGFVAQKIGAEQVGPNLFNGVRYLIGSLAVLPLYLRRLALNPRRPSTKWRRDQALACTLIGVTLFAASLLQQMGIASTTSGNSGFITTLYVVIVPFIMRVLGHKINLSQWGGSALAVVGLALLSLTDQFTLVKGDLLTLASAGCWALQAVLLYLYRRYSPTAIAFYQLAICGGLSLALGLVSEDTNTLHLVWWPMLYSGLITVGLGFSLQILAQQRADPAHAVLLLSLESVFAMLGGVLFLQETISPRGALGALLILLAIWIAQRKRRTPSALN